MTSRNAVAKFPPLLYTIATAISWMPIAVCCSSSLVLSNIAAETIAAIEAMFPEMVDDMVDDTPEAPGREADAAALAASLRWLPVPAQRSGYVQSIDDVTLLRLACESDLVVRVEHAVGQFVLAGTPIFSIASAGAPGGAIASALHGAIALSAYRTVEQDPAFGVRQLVDVALKALSPGINDTTTAVMCLDYLGAVMATMARRGTASSYRLAGGALKIVVPVPDFAGMLAEAFNQIRRNAGGNVTVIVRMIATVETLASLVVEKGRRQDLLTQLDYIAELSARTVPAPHDSAQVAKRLAPLRRVLAGSQ